MSGPLRATPQVGVGHESPAESAPPLRMWVRWAEPGLVVVALAAFWQFASQMDVLPREDFPPVTDIMSALVADLQTADLWAGVAASMEAWLLGMLLVISIGVPVGMLLGAPSISYRLSYLTLEFIRTTQDLRDSQ